MGHEGHLDPAAFLDGENLTVGDNFGFATEVLDGCARCPVGLHAGAVEVLDGHVPVDDGVPHQLGFDVDDDLVDVIGLRHGSSLEFRLEPGHCPNLGLRVFADPPVVDQPDRNRVQVVELAPPVLAGGYELGLLEHSQVAHHPEAGHVRQVSCQFTESLAVIFE